MIHIFSSSLFLAFLEGGDGWMDAKGKIYIFLFFSFTFGHMEIYNRRLFVSFFFFKFFLQFYTREEWLSFRDLITRQLR
jgi:hypothetical protein